MTATLHVLVGLPGSGKSTHAAQLARKKPSLIVLTADEFRISGTDPGRVFAQLYRDLRSHLANRHDVVVDTCALTHSARGGYLTVAHEHGARTRVTVLRTPIALCQTRNAQRGAQRATVDWTRMRQLYETSLREIRFEPWDDASHL